MNGMIACSVDNHGQMHVSNEAGALGEARVTYLFDLGTRRLLGLDGHTPAQSPEMEAYLQQVVGTPEGLMHLASEGGLLKRELADLLVSEKRQAFLDACAVIEKGYTDACAAENDPCLERGCAVEGEICLEAILKNRTEYEKAVAAEWAKLFADQRNRVDAWKH
jgi:hypothetical protein